MLNIFLWRDCRSPLSLHVDLLSVHKFLAYISIGYSFWYNVEFFGKFPEISSIYQCSQNLI